MIDFNSFLQKSLDFSKDPNNRKYFYFTGGVLAGLLGLWIFIQITSPIVKSVCRYVLERGAPLGEKDRRFPVEAKVLDYGTITRRIKAVGILKPNESVTLRSEMNGQIKEIHFKQGSEVEEGDLLISFDDSDLLAELAQAKAELEMRKAEFERVEKLKDKAVHSDKKYQEAQAQYKVALAKVESAEARLKKSKIYASFPGKIGLIYVSPGAYIQTGQELTHLVKDNPMYVDFKVPEHYIHDIGVGQRAEVYFEGVKGQSFVAVVDAIDAKVDEKSHSIAVRGTIHNPDGLLKAGLYAVVSLIIGEKSDALLVPETAVMREGKIEYVWVIEKGKAQFRRILTGTREKGMVEITAGLRPGEVVVEVGTLGIVSGMPVRIMNLQEEEAPAEEPVEKEEGEEVESEEDTDSLTDEETQDIDSEDLEGEEEEEFNPTEDEETNKAEAELSEDETSNDEENEEEPLESEEASSSEETSQSKTTSLEKEND